MKEMPPKQITPQVYTVQLGCKIRTCEYSLQKMVTCSS